MKANLFYTLLCLATLVAQTTVLRFPLFGNVVFDLFVPMVVFARLNLSTRAAALLTLAVGLGMDLFSGGQFGLYLSTYLWIFVGVSAVSSYCHVQGNLFRSLLIAVAVLFENLACCLFSAFPDRVLQALSAEVGSVLWQVALAAAAGPWVVRMLEKAHRRVGVASESNGKAGVGLWMTHT